MTADLLKEVSKDEVKSVLEELKKDWPTNFLLHQYIIIMEQYRKENKQITQTLYRHGDIDNRVYILKASWTVVGQATVAQYFIGTNSADLSDLPKLLVKCSEISLREGVWFEINYSKFTPYVTQALTSNGFQFSVLNTIMMWLPPEVELDIGVLPEGVCLKNLEQSHIQEIDANWPHRHPGSDKFLAHELQINFGLGLFRKTDNKLLSSSISLHSGGVFILYTNPDHRKKGYAEVIVRNMAQEIRKRGRIPFGTIVDENILSLNLFKKIGFKEFSRVNFIFVT